MSDILELRRNADLMSLIPTKLKRVSNTEGGELAGPCPFCTEYGEDRFRLQPNHPGGQRWFCRQCSPLPWHDVLDYVQKRDSCDLPTAIKTLEGGAVSTLPTKKKTETQPEIDREKWTYRAGQFISYCCEKLWGEDGARPLAYLHSRGLQDETLKRWWIGFNPTTGYDDPGNWGIPGSEQMKLSIGITIPIVDQLGTHAVKIRRSSSKPKYLYVTGSKFWLYGAPNLRDTLTAVLFESELDALLAWQTGYRVGCCAMPAGQNIRPEWQPFFDGIEDVIVAYDEDEPGQKAADKLCNLPHFWKAPHLPHGKDLTEFAMGGGDVLEYLYDALGVIPRGH
jgi:DNA primase